MDIKEIALRLLAEEFPGMHQENQAFLVEFAEALISAYKAELLKEAGEPVAWRADVATDFGIEDRYSGWETWLINYEPNCPLGSMRNKTGLYTSDQVAAAVLKATKPLQSAPDQIRRMGNDLVSSYRAWL